VVGNTRKIIAITEGAYPVGGAPTNRHLSYLKGLVELGNSVDLVITYPAKNQPEQSSEPNGTFNGIRYKYTLGSTLYERNKYKRLFNRLKSVIRSVKDVKNKIIESEINTTKIIVLTTSLFDTLPFLLLAKIYNVEIFHERTEHPFINIRQSFISRLQTRVYLKYIVPHFTGVFVISHFLKAFFSHYTDNKIEIINMTVEPERFDVKRDRDIEYIAYTGSMYTNKDGVPDLLAAFDIVAERYNQYRLFLIGDNTDKRKFKYIYEIINSMKWKDNVICTGLLPRDEIPHLVVNAKILALARPNNLQAKAGFPTKLGEYLVTGNPVVITSVGEIPKYLIHNHNAFIAKPDNSVDFAAKLIEVIENYEHAIEVGQRGKALCETEFNYKVQAKKLNNFLYGIC
jgi:glycosyltransferase involved in cell wall biosynthesis